MGCYHRYGHGCDWPLPPPEWDRYDYYRPRRYSDEVVVLRDDEITERRRGGSGRGRRCRERTATEAATTASLQKRVELLREELARIEDELAEHDGSAGPRPVD